jgi:hypothetical protein
LRRSQRVRVFKPGGRSTGSQVQVKVGQVSDSRRDPVGYARRCGYADGGSVSAERKQRNHCRSSTQSSIARLSDRNTECRGELGKRLFVQDMAGGQLYKC